MKMESMSKNIVKIMVELANNDGLARLLINNNSTPFATSVDKSKIITTNADESKIFPYPFDVEAQTEDGSFIRVYYNNGEFNSNEVIAESQLHIDIICARSLWLINSGNPTPQKPNGDGESQIRPYEIMGRVVDMVGKRGLSKTIKLKFDGWQHLYINTKFDAIRLYGNYMSVESKYPNEKEYLDR